MDIPEQRITILVVEDSELQREFLSAQLEEKGFRVLQAETGAMARQIMDRDVVDAVLLDWELPDVKGPELLREWKSHIHHQWVPVLMVTAYEQSDKLLVALEAGAVDFIRKPPDEVELQARLGSALRIRELQLKLREQATLDPLTGICNRRELMERLKYEFARCRRYGNELSVAVIDIDYFKQINDLHGHDAGDLVLTQFATFFVRSLRSVDTVARFGGEEFFVLLPETSLPAAKICFDRLRLASLASPWGKEDEPVQMTWCAGVTSLASSEASSVFALVKFADLAVYEAKRGGRDKIVVK